MGPLNLPQPFYCRFRFELNRQKEAPRIPRRLFFPFVLLPCLRYLLTKISRAMAESMANSEKPTLNI
jgi:hypothetical protein